MAEIIDIQQTTALGYLPHYAPQKRSIKNISFDIRDRETINLIIPHQTSRKKLANTRVGNPLTVPNLSKFLIHQNIVSLEKWLCFWILTIIPMKSPILQCPQCKKSLVNIASEVERIHPIPRFIKKYSYRMLGWWTLATFPILYILAEHTNLLGLRHIVFAWFALICFPCVVIYILPRFFSVYRITHCPYCGFHDEVKLGKALDV